LLLNLHLLVAMAGQYERSFRSFGEWQRLLALACVGLTSPGHLPVLMAQQAQTQAPPQAEEQKPKLKTADQLDSLVAPIALYPDPLLAQVLAATTYPLEIVQAQRWLKSNTTLKGEELTKAAAKQPWDPSVQALVAFPSALKLLDENIQWTQISATRFWISRPMSWTRCKGCGRRRRITASWSPAKSRRSRQRPSRAKQSL